MSSSALQPYLNSEYTFTPYIPELIKPLGKNRGLIIAQLLGKLHIFNPTAEIHHIYGKQYHFYYSKKEMATKEILIDYKEFNKYINDMSEYVTAFAGRQKDDSGYNITYFFIHLEKIRELFAKGTEMLGRKLKQNAPAVKTEKKTEKSLPPKIKKLLDKINDIEKSWQMGRISEIEYRNPIGELKALVNLDYKITFNKKLKTWQIL